MTVLWCGGEDVDFPNGSAISIGTSSGSHYDPDYSRCGVCSAGTAYICKSNVLPTPLTDLWLSAIIYIPIGNTINKFIGIGKNGYNSGVLIGTDTYTNGKLALFKVDNLTYTLLAAESGVSLVTAAKYDINIQNFDTTATIKVYINGNEYISYTGDAKPSGVGSLDQIFLFGNGSYGYMSSIIVADEDTRLMRLKTLAPSAAGDTSANWTGAYTDIDETTLSDADKIYSATNNADFQTNLTGMPSGTWSVKAVKVAARCVDGSLSTGIQLGIKSGGTVGSGDTQTASGYWQTKERLMIVNQVTGVAFTPAEIEALQINLRAVTL